MHGLIESHDYHNEDEAYTVDDAVCSYGYVAAVFKQGAVDDKYHQTGGYVHKTGGETYFQHIPYQIPAQSVYPALQMYDLALVKQLGALPCKCHNLRNDSGYGGSANSPMENHYKEVVQDYVEEHRAYGGCHSLLRMSGCPQYAVNSQIEVCEDIACQYYNHIFTGIAYGYIGSAKDSQDRV